MDNMWLKIYQALNKQAPQFSENSVLNSDPRYLDIELNSENISPEEYLNMLKFMQRANEQKVVTPYSQEMIQDTSNAMARGIAKSMLGMRPNYIELTKEDKKRMGK